MIVRTNFYKDLAFMMSAIQLNLIWLSRQVNDIFFKVVSGIRYTLGLTLFLLLTVGFSLISAICVLAINISLWKNRCQLYLSSEKNSNLIIKGVFFLISAPISLCESVISLIARKSSSFFSKGPLYKLRNLSAEKMGVSAQFFCYYLSLLTSLPLGVIKFTVKPALNVVFSSGFKYVDYNFDKFTARLQEQINQLTTGGFKGITITKDHLSQLLNVLKSSDLDDDIIKLVCTDEIYQLIEIMYQKDGTQDKSFFNDQKLYSLGKYLQTDVKLKVVVSTLTKILLTTQQSNNNSETTSETQNNTEILIREIITRSGHVLEAFYDPTLESKLTKKMEKISEQLSSEEFHIHDFLSSYVQSPIFVDSKKKHSIGGQQKKINESIKGKIQEFNRSATEKDKVLLTAKSLILASDLDNKKEDCDLFKSINNSTENHENVGWTTAIDLMRDAKLAKLWQSHGLILEKSNQSLYWFSLKNESEKTIILISSDGVETSIKNGESVIIYLKQEWNLTDFRVNTKDFRAHIDSIITTLSKSDLNKNALKYLIKSALENHLGRTALSLLSIIPYSPDKKLVDDDIKAIDSTLCKLSNSDKTIDWIVGILDKFRFSNFAPTSSQKALLLKEDLTLKDNEAENMLSMVIESLNKEFIASALNLFTADDSTAHTLNINSTDIHRFIEVMCELHNFGVQFGGSDSDKNKFNPEEHVKSLKTLLSFALKADREEKDKPEDSAELSTHILNLLKPLTNNFKKEDTIKTIEALGVIQNKLYTYNNIHESHTHNKITHIQKTALDKLLQEYIYLIYSKNLYLTPVSKDQFVKRYSSIIPATIPEPAEYKKHKQFLELIEKAVSWYLGQEKRLELTTDHIECLSVLSNNVIKSDIICTEDIAHKIVSTLYPDSGHDTKTQLSSSFTKNLNLLREKLKDLNIGDLNVICKYLVGVMDGECAINKNLIQKLALAAKVPFDKRCSTLEKGDDSYSEVVSLINYLPSESESFLQKLDLSNPVVQHLINDSLDIISNSVEVLDDSDITTIITQRDISKVIQDQRVANPLLKELGTAITNSSGVYKDLLNSLLINNYKDSYNGFCSKLYFKREEDLLGVIKWVGEFATTRTDVTREILVSVNNTYSSYNNNKIEYGDPLLLLNNDEVMSSAFNAINNIGLSIPESSLEWLTESGIILYQGNTYEIEEGNRDHFENLGALSFELLVNLLQKRVGLSGSDKENEKELFIKAFRQLQVEKLKEIPGCLKRAERITDLESVKISNQKKIDKIYRNFKTIIQAAKPKSISNFLSYFIAIITSGKNGVDSTSKLINHIIEPIIADGKSDNVKYLIKRLLEKDKTNTSLLENIIDAHHDPKTESYKNIFFRLKEDYESILDNIFSIYDDKDIINKLIDAIKSKFADNESSSADNAKILIDIFKGLDKGRSKELLILILKEIFEDDESLNLLSNYLASNGKGDALNIRLSTVLINKIITEIGNYEHSKDIIASVLQAVANSDNINSNLLSYLPGKDSRFGSIVSSAYPPIAQALLVSMFTSKSNALYKISGIICRSNYHSFTSIAGGFKSMCTSTVSSLMFSCASYTRHVATTLGCRKRPALGYKK